MSQRAELLKIVEKENTEAVVEFLKNAKLQGRDLSDTLAECSRRQLEDMWGSLRKVCTEILLNDSIEGNQQEEQNKKASQYAFLDGLVTLATATIQQKDVVLPQALIDTAALLHGVLLTLPDEVDALKFRLAHLFETWWRQQLEGWEDVIANTLIYLLKRSLSKGTASDVKAVWRLHTVMPLINFETPSAADLKNLLGRCCSSAQYLKIDEGRRFVGYVMTLNTGLVDWLHRAIKSQIPYAPKWWLPVYGEIYFRAWQKSSGDIVQDAVYTDLSRAFLAKGCGARKKITSLSFNHKLMLQMYLLKEQPHANKTWDDVEVFLQKFCGETPRYRLRNVIEKSIKTVEKIDNDTELSSFFQSPVTLEKAVGPFSEEIGLTEAVLKSSSFDTVCSNPTIGLVTELEKFRKSESLPFRDLHAWICKLTMTDVPVFQLNKKLTKVKEELKRLQKKSGSSAGASAVQSFMQSPFPLPQTVSSLSTLPTGDSSSSSTSTFPRQTGASDTVLKLANKQEELAAARRKHADMEEKLRLSMAETSILQADLLAANTTIQSLHKSQSHLEDLMRQLDFSKGELRAAEAEKADLKTRLNRYSKGTLQRQFNEQAEALQRLQQENETTRVKNEHLKEKVCEWRAKFRRLQLDKAELNRRYDRARRKVKALLGAKENATDEEQLPVNDIPVVRLKDEKGHFKKEAIVCVMTLIGECEVPADRCGAIIRSVVHHICRARVPDADLPSQRSALRFADQGHVIGKAHVAETLLQCDHWDLHSDGTSRSGKKYVGQQITVKGNSLSTGFTPVATEDTSTLVDISVQLLEELSDIFPAEEAQQNFIQMLQNLSGIMTDRASVMKSFGRELQKEKQTLLQTDEDLQFLHCNAHFLLGLGAECKKLLAAREKESGERLGRDRLPKFNTHYKGSESSAFRYIRLACDCLGPRGDDKNGCRDAWEAYCLMVERRSTVTSFRENRFNNLFQAAGSLHFHRQDIQACLGTYLPKLNNKTESVLADCESEEIDCHLVALGLLYFRVTGPYWSLLGTALHYLDFHYHIGRLHTLLQDWQTDASHALDANFQPLFPDVHFQHNDNILQSLLCVGDEKAAKVKSILEEICTGLVTVTERQLGDFLPGGKYCNVEDPALREKMQHSLITNLVGEQCFGDLDFSLFKRRNASLHHHSTVNMLKRNRSVSSWLSKKTEQEQEEMLQMSATKSASLRKQHILLEKGAVIKKKELLLEVQQKKQDAAEKKRQEIMDMMDTLRPHHGPCVSGADVDQLLRAYKTRAHQKTALRAEIKYHKLVLNQKSPLLKVTGAPLTLANNLKRFLGGGVDELLQCLPPIPWANGPRNKRPRREVFDNAESSESSVSSESDGDEEEHEDENLAAEETGVKHYLADSNFQFHREGEIVAVYYQEDFFIGEVTRVQTTEDAEVNFMEKTNATSQGHCIFRWPFRPDCCVISSEVVFAGDLTLSPSSSSGRAFVVDKPSNLPERYKIFKRFLMENCPA